MFALRAHVIRASLASMTYGSQRDVSRIPRRSRRWLDPPAAQFGRRLPERTTTSSRGSGVRVPSYALEVGSWRRPQTYGVEKVVTYRANGLRRLASMLRFRRRGTRLPPEYLDDPPPDIGVREPRRPRPFGGAGAATLDPPQ
jgi:hypothetical protein